MCVRERERERESRSACDSVVYVSGNVLSECMSTFLHVHPSVCCVCVCACLRM